MSTGALATAEGSSTQDDEWFGEGSAFDSGEDLAAALFALAGAMPTERNVIPPVEVVWPISMPQSAPVFVEVQRPGTLDGARRPGSLYSATKSASASPGSWSVRSPGEQLLPPKVSGRSGWTIRNSVTVLHRTEDAIARLREEAVAMAFLAAAEACGRGRPASLERRSHPR
ncbi:MAG TPA: hypothetical protein VND54_01310 [Candidatus Saccharimonadales bacterium]|nr:hypothetical protein [Candidatus Saccharimonadales bacterium]